MPDSIRLLANLVLDGCRCRANSAYIKESRPDHGLEFQENKLQKFHVVPSSLDRGSCAAARSFHRTRGERPRLGGRVVEPCSDCFKSHGTGERSGVTGRDRRSCQTASASSRILSWTYTLPTPSRENLPRESDSLSAHNSARKACPELLPSVPICCAVICQCNSSPQPSTLSMKPS